MPRADGLWIISPGGYTSLDMSRINGRMKTGPVMEYGISDLTRYLLNPNPIEVLKKLVGCEVRYSPPTQSKSIKHLFQKLSFRKQGKGTPNETLIFDQKTKATPFKDKHLAAHINTIYRLLKPYDPTFKRLLSLNREAISDITGICEDIDGNRMLLSLKGGIDEKIHYMSNYILEDVGVVLEKAFVAEGFFEMRGFDFTSYTPKNVSRLLKFYEDGISKACVLNHKGEIEYWLTDTKLIHFMQLLEQSIQNSPNFCDSFKLCTEGNATPLRLLFNRSIAIDYSKARLPEAYRDVFDHFNVGLTERDVIINTLKNHQLGIMFQYIPKSNYGEEKLFTNISVLHDIRALDSIKDDLPHLYFAMDKKASVSEAGKYYLLDFIRGCTSEN
jgi:hypothetical protein